MENLSQSAGIKQILNLLIFLTLSMTTILQFSALNYLSELYCFSSVSYFITLIFCSPFLSQSFGILYGQRIGISSALLFRSLGIGFSYAGCWWLHLFQFRRLAYCLWYWDPPSRFRLASTHFSLTHQYFWEFRLNS